MSCDISHCKQSKSMSAGAQRPTKEGKRKGGTDHEHAGNALVPSHRTLETERVRVIVSDHDRAILVVNKRL